MLPWWYVLIVWYNDLCTIFSNNRWSIDFFFAVTILLAWHCHCHWATRSGSLSVIIMEPNNTTAASHSPAFTCFNVTCYATFKTERSLHQNLWQSAPCRDYMSEPRPLASSLGIVHESSWRRCLGYGIESSRLNPFMSADPPSYAAYEVFNYSANHDEVDGIDEQIEMSDNSPRGIGNVAVCCPVFHAKMKCIQAGDCQEIMALHHDVEHQNIVNLL